MCFRVERISIHQFLHLPKSESLDNVKGGGLLLLLVMKPGYERIERIVLGSLEL